MRITLTLVLFFTGASPIMSIATQPSSTTNARQQPLTECPAGCRAIVHTHQLEDGPRTMLEAMGVEHGCEVEICKVGSPCILKVSSGRLGVGHEVASRIMATVHPNEENVRS